MSTTETLERIDVRSSGTFNDVDVSASRIQGILTPLQKFMFGFKSPETRRQYPKLLLKFLDFLKLHGTLEQKSTEFLNLANRNPDHVENESTKFVMLHNERIYRKEIAAGTLRNYIKAVRLFCEMNKINLSWELLTKGLPPVKQYPDDLYSYSR